MSHIRRKMILGTVGLMLVGLNLHLGAGQALGESHSKSDDSQTPYQVSTNIIPSTCTFNSVLYFCDVKFPAVPAGKRLVIEHVSLFVALNAGNPDSVRFRNSSNGTAFWVQPIFTT